MTRVYVDIENAIRVPFLSGIQRVVFELVPRLVSMSTDDLSFIPVRHCRWCDGWVMIDESEIRQSLIRKQKRGETNQSPRVFVGGRRLGQVAKSIRMVNDRLRHDTKSHQESLVKRFESGSVFLDLDSSWHNDLSRRKFLPAVRSNGVKVMSVHYDSIPIRYPQFVHPQTIPRFREHFEAKIHDSDRILCISQSVANEIIEVPGCSGIIETFRLGDKFTNFFHDSALVPSPVTDSQYILCVGTVEPRKNHVTLISAYERLIESGVRLDLVIVGREGWMCSDIRKTIVTNPYYGKRIHWLRDCPDSDLNALYENAYLSVVPSVCEGYGLPVTESLAAGCVTLSSNAGALQEAGGEFADYFDPNDSDALFEMLKSYADNSAAYEKRKRKVITRRQYSWDDSAMDLYRRCVSLGCGER